ncbi:LOB domain-containing protein 36-like [Carica papaya]|uniref:LOB domain-containing protein 36-like n=1 Tax=Carica papaya TaxID=3649 RepID=UPI000B8CE81F|nr:LOB domain-containing protein 36-like [Carica papaya]XP_021908028.1 LOB domain-containing protein 36-like [Carica papaya]XP_021908029.1 LOB domain-containing protein 36-like [Carica papaya]XP_021908030.1 LOB domain-containing protein 36-like [Carica papaya]
MSSANTPCAACKLQRRKCTQECVFAPYFPPDQPQKFAYVHKVFGASNVAKILNELNASQREDAVNSLFYEAEARLRDPVYGCVGLISILQHRLKQVQTDLLNAKKELATYIGPQAMLPMLQGPTFVAQQPLGMGNSPSSSMLHHNMMPMMGIPAVPSHGGGQLVIREPQQQQQQQQQHHSQQIFEAQPLGAVTAVREQHHHNMFRVYDQQQQHQPPQQPELVRFNSGFEASAGSVTATGFSQMNSSGMSASLAVGNFDTHYQIQGQPETHHHQIQAQLLLQPQQPQPQPHPHPQPQAAQQRRHQQPQQQQRPESEEGRSVDPSC